MASAELVADSLEALRNDVVICRRCPRLVAWREQVAAEKRAMFRDEQYWGRPLPGFGDPAGRVFILGLAPAAHGGNRTGRIFTGDRSGDWLVRAMYRAGFANQPTSLRPGDGLEFRDAYVAAAVRCAQPGNKPTPEERANCQPFLQRELLLLPGACVIVALGAFATESVAALFGMRPRPRFGHGREYPLSGNRKLLCSYHPSQRNTSTGLLTEAMFDQIFSRARELAGSASNG